MINRSPRLFFFIFTASGFAGLIYESIWTHYLKLFLGHAAYAQALVLAVFMGGMAIGSLFCAKYSERISNLLIGYVVVEVIIGLCAALFHPIYAQFIELAYTSFMPALGSPAAVATFKWAAAVLLILPQSILLGMTFPLMTAGLLRRFPGTPGSTIAMLYFTNSIGAAIGVLASGFLFIGWVGLPGTLIIASFINITVAAVVWLEDKQYQSIRAKDRPTATPHVPGTTPPVVYAVFLLIALLTGLSSFIYEIGWIRMLSLVLGSSTHSFELMLSAFIMGIAFGGLWIKRRIDQLDDPRRYLAHVQIAMGILALATLPVYGGTFNVMAWLIRNVPKSEMGYVLFNLTSHGIAVAIMLPTAFCAGMTLPLITAALLRNSAGEKSVGAVYGFNTIGSILGVFTAIHVAMPLLGLKGTIILGAGIDIALGLGLVWWSHPSWGIRTAYAATGVAALLFPMLWVDLDAGKMASGVYRYGTILDPGTTETIFHRDGKTATVSVVKDSRNMEIRTNGKPDAGIRVTGNGHASDEETMVLAGTIGALFQPEARTAAIIGWGSGLTTHTLLTSPQIRSIDTIEIEPEMIEAARLFGSRVRLAYNDPRSHRHIEDAKSYFSFHNRKYDIIISEPSNPWVSGVASLFTSEFYSRIRQHLNDNGLFIQWIQLYEIDMPLVASIMNALAPNFSDYAIYAASRADMLIVARPAGTLREHYQPFSALGEMAGELRRIDVLGPQDIKVRLLGNKKVLAPYFASYAITTNSDFAPVVDLYAVRSRFFLSSSYDQFHALSMNRLPIVQMLGGRVGDATMPPVSYAAYPKSQKIHFSEMLYHYLMNGQWKWSYPDNPLNDEAMRSAIVARQVLIKECQGAMDIVKQEWWRAMLNTITDLVPYLSSEQLTVLLRAIESPVCREQLTSGQREFISLIRAVGNKDPAHMSLYAGKLLNQMRQKNVVQPDLLEYVLSVGLLGNISSGNMREAALLWETNGHLLPGDKLQSPSIRLLIAHLYRGKNSSP
jgi:predicted membrane-bound spermidine synthase